MSPIRLYHVLPRAKFATDRLASKISCSPNEWAPYPAGSVVFFFEDKLEAIGYALSRRSEDPVIIALYIERSRVENDRSAQRDARAALLELWPDADEHALARISGDSPWRTAVAHFGAVRLPQEVEEIHFE